MKEKFTPAPWEWVKDRNTDGYYGLYNGDNPIVYPQRCNDGDEGLAWFSTDESYYGETALKEADAALIAAAPDMYSLLNTILDTQRKYYGDGMSLHIAMIGLADQIEHLLAKARGEI